MAEFSIQVLSDGNWWEPATVVPIEDEVRAFRNLENAERAATVNPEVSAVRLIRRVDGVEQVIETRRKGASIP